MRKSEKIIYAVFCLVTPLVIGMQIYTITIKSLDAIVWALATCVFTLGHIAWIKGIRNGSSDT